MKHIYLICAIAFLIMSGAQAFGSKKNDSDFLGCAEIKKRQNDYKLKFILTKPTVYHFKIISKNAAAMGMKDGFNINGDIIKIRMMVKTGNKLVARYAYEPMGRLTPYSLNEDPYFFWGGATARKPGEKHFLPPDFGWTFSDGVNQGWSIGVKYTVLVSLVGDVERFLEVYGQSKLVISERQID